MIGTVPTARPTLSAPLMRAFRHVLLSGAALGIYAWHGKHHAAHVTGLRERMGW